MSNDKAALLVVSGSGALTDSVVSILGRLYHIAKARTLDDGFSIINKSKPSLCLIDFTLASTRGGQAIAQLKKHNSDMLIFLACPREQKAELLESNLSSEAYRVLFTPLSPGQTKLSLATAVKQLESQGKKPQTLQTEAKSTPPPAPVVKNISIEKTKPVKTNSNMGDNPEQQFDDIFLGKKHSTRLDLNDTDDSEPLTENIFIEKTSPVKPKTPAPKLVPPKSAPPKQVPPKLAPPKPVPPKPAPPKPAPSKPAPSKPAPSKPAPPKPAPPQGIRPNRGSASRIGKLSRSTLIPVVATIAVIAVAASAWLLLKDNSGDPEAQALKLQLEAAEAEKKLKIEQLLQTAQAQLLKNNYFPPARNNALDSYVKVLDLDNSNKLALDGLTELSKHIFGDLDLHLANGNIRQAQQSVRTARQRAAKNKTFASRIEALLQEKKTTLTDSANIALAAGNNADAANLNRIAQAAFATPRSSAGKQAAQVAQLIKNTNNAIEFDRLLAPTQNNAQYFIKRIEDLKPDDPNLVQLKQRFASALLLKAKAATEANDFLATQNFLDAAYSANADDDALTTELIRLSDARLTLEQSDDNAVSNEAAAPNVEDGTTQESREAPVAQEPVSQEPDPTEIDAQTEAARLSSPVDVALSELNATNRTAPTYPKRYEERGISGSAQIGFTVNTDGSLSNVKVLSVEPDNATAFGNAAVKAVEKWSFEPYVDAEGTVRIAASQVKINFQSSD